jgi:hypothetical protein
MDESSGASRRFSVVGHLKTSAGFRYLREFAFASQTVRVIREDSSSSPHGLSPATTQVTKLPHLPSATS